MCLILGYQNIATLTPVYHLIMILNKQGGLLYRPTEKRLKVMDD